MPLQSIRMETMRPDEVHQRWQESPIAFVPIGCIEYHGPHLPLGVDGMTAHAVCMDAAERVGGVVHPISYLANGCLDLPYTLTYPPSVVEAWARAITEQLHHRGAELVVLLTGHGPLDLIHLLKRVARDLDRRGARVYGLCYLELNAARLDGPVVGEPTVIDHASTVETSWMMAHHPALVDLSMLPDDPDAATVGVYGRNPRFTASVDLGEQQRQQCGELLAERCAAILNGDWTDTMADLGAFVDFAWPEPLELILGGSDAGLQITNPGRASRYITQITEVSIDGQAVDLQGATLVNRSHGEVGQPFLVADLSPEHGIYVRRGQQVEFAIPTWGENPVDSRISVRIELAGVRHQVLTWSKSKDHESVANP
jgi:creatinine amidohydrolase